MRSCAEGRVSLQPSRHAESAYIARFCSKITAEVREFAAKQNQSADGFIAASAPLPLAK